MRRLLSLLHAKPWLFLAQAFVGLPLMAALFIGFAELVSLLVDWGALAVYLFLMARIIWALLRARSLEEQFGFLSSGWNGLKASVVLVFVSYVLFYTLFFALTCRELYMVFGLGFVLQGTDGIWSWLAFGLDNLLEILLLDVPEIYGLTLSGVHAESFWAASTVLAFRLSLDLVLIKWIFEILSLLLWREREVQFFSAIKALIRSGEPAEATTSNGNN